VRKSHQVLTQIFYGIFQEENHPTGTRPHNRPCKPILPIFLPKSTKIDEKLYNDPFWIKMFSLKYLE